MLGRKNGSVEAQPFRDADTVREFVSGSAMLAFFDLPWVPLFVAAAFLLHPVFGWLTIGAGVLDSHHHSDQRIFDEEAAAPGHSGVHLGSC